MGIRTRNTVVTKLWRVCRPPIRQDIRTGWRWLPRLLALVIAPCVLGSCAELGGFRSDISHLRADLHSTTEALSQLMTRVDELERRQVATDNTVRQTQQELTQAVDVLLKKALVTENRLLSMASEKKPPADTAKLDRQVRQRTSESPPVAAHENNSVPEATPLSLGMSQEDVRRTLGDPISVENTGAYIFWQYSLQNNQKYVVFDKITQQLWGWRGL